MPRHQASVDLSVASLDGLTLTLNGIYVGERYLESDFANDFEQQDHYKVFNLKVNYSWQRYTAFLDLNNIFNEKYSSYGVLSDLPRRAGLLPIAGVQLFRRSALRLLDECS